MKIVIIALDSIEQGMLLAALLDKAASCEDKQTKDNYLRLYGDVQEAIMLAKEVEV